MAITQNTYTGNGSTTNYSFTFEYIKAADVKASLDGTATTAFTLANATTLSFNTAPANGVAIRIFRDTDIDNLKATFSPGSAIKAEDLNDNFTQNNFAVQEADFDVATANTTANTAKTTADSATATANTASTNASNAVTTANSAVATANTASTNASSAVSTANTASTNATNAVNTANAASTTANTASTNATTALNNSRESDGSGGFVSAISKANTAVSTANTASTNASAAVTTANSASSTANTASTNATNAVNTANAASAAVAAAVLYDPVANVSAIPASPSDGDYVEVNDSTGIESFSPLSGLPSGFVGASGLTVRLKYVTSPSTTWQWQNYFANDSETRYIKKTSGTGAAILPNGTTAQRDGSPVAGYIRFNSTLSQFEGYNGTSWASVGGGATGGGSDQWALEHDNTITASYSISTGKNVITAGPITVNSGVTVTVPSGSNWTIV